jgi:uncharacterized membrane protein YccC
MTTLIATISMLAALIGLGGIVPQLSTMLRARSSAGQSTVGWTFALSTNSALAFVNLFGYHAWVLGSGNVASFLGCLTAVYLVRRFRARPSEPTVSDMHTQEFAVLREAVLHEHHRRTGEQQLALQLS